MDQLLLVDDVEDPGKVVSRLHVDAGHVGLRATDSVRHNGRQRPAPVVVLDGQRTAGIALQFKLFFEN